MTVSGKASLIFRTFPMLRFIKPLTLDIIASAKSFCSSLSRRLFLVS